MTVKKHAPDYWILVLSIALTAFGVIMILSASYYANSGSGDALYYFKKQLISAAVGFAAMFVLYKMNYHMLRGFSTIIVCVAIVLLALVLFVGTNVNGAQRWISIGGFSLQPSEVAKFALVLFYASFFSRDPQRITKLKYILLSLVPLAVVVILVMLQPNFSTSICLVATAIAVLFVAGLRWYYFAIATGVVGAGGLALLFAAPYRIQRLQSFIDPWSDPLGSGYQLIQSLYALSSGGLLGVGLGNSRQKYLYMPFAESDFIFSIIAEEVGLIGCCLLFLVFILLIWRCILVAVRAKDTFGALLATGICAMFGIQTIINLAVVTGSIPPTGIPLPFISYGGTSLIITLASMGVIMNISAYGEQPAPKPAMKKEYQKNSIWKRKST